MNRLDVQDDLSCHNRVANETLPSRIVNLLGMDVLNVLRRFQSRLAFGVANEADLLGRTFGAKVIVMAINCAELPITSTAVVEFSLWVDAKTVTVAIWMILLFVTVVVDCVHFLAANLALLDDLWLLDSQMYDSEMDYQVFLANEESVGATITLEWLKIS